MGNLFLPVVLVWLLLETHVGVLSANKIRPWRTGTDVNPWMHRKPSPRELHGMVAAAGSLWVFGGDDQDGAVDAGFFQLDIETKQWTSITTSGPSPRARSRFAMALLGDVIYIFGGHIIDTPAQDASNDLWGFSLFTLEWTLHDTTTGNTRPSAKPQSSSILGRTTLPTRNAPSSKAASKEEEGEPRQPQPQAMVTAARMQAAAAANKGPHVIRK